MTLLVATIYGMTAGMALALAVGAGLLPVNWGAAFPGAPLALQAFLTSAGALVGALIAVTAAWRHTR